MAEGDTHFEVSATLRLKKSKFEKDARRAARTIDPLARGLKRASAKANVLSFNMLELARKQKMAQRASEQANRAAEMADRVATRLAEKRSREMRRLARAAEMAERATARLAARRSREMEKLARQARRAEMAMSRLNRKAMSRGLSKGFGAGRGAMGMGGGMAAMGGVARVAGGAALLGGAATAFGLGAATIQGLRFNKTMEDTKNSVATMFQMFDVGKAYFEAGQGEADVFSTNIALAKEAVAELMVLQTKTPAGFTQIAQVFGQGIAGLAKGTKDVKRMLNLVTQISMLGPSLNNDYGQLGRDTMRILSGSAEQEVQIWRLLKEQFKEIGTAEGLFQKGLDDEKFTKQFNKVLSAAQRMDLFEKAMSKLGPKFEALFRASMSGLLSSTASKLKMVVGALTEPLYDSFLKFLGNINLDTILTSEMVQRWMGVAKYFGNILGDAAHNLFESFERAMFYVDRNWSKITDSIIFAFDVGGLLIKGYIAQALTRAALAPILGVAGKGVGAAGKATKFGFKFAKIFDKMGLGKLTGFKKLGAVLKLLGMMIGPTIIAFTVLASAVAIIGVMVGAMAAYLVENWKKITQSIMDNWDTASGAIQKVYLAAYRAWDMLVRFGEVLLGGSSEMDKFEVLMGLLEKAFILAAKAIVMVVEALAGFYKLAAIERGGSELTDRMYASLFQGMAVVTERLPGMGDKSREFAHEARGYRRRAGRTEEEGLELAGESIKMSRLAAELEGMIDRTMTEKERERAEAEAEKKLRTLTGKDAEGKGKGTPPVGGVHITNQYNQWDLRQTDPDRIMSAFIPKLESLADKRNQSYEQVEQGV